MSKLPPSKSARDANLDALTSAVQKWGDKEKKRLENEVKYVRAVLKGRAASEKNGTQNLDILQEILKLEIEDFIAYGPEQAARKNFQ